MSECKLGLIPILAIDTSKRTRQDYKDIAALASDIKRRGLIHPIAVMENESVIAKTYLLLAGGRRLKACESLRMNDIECKIFPSGLTTLEIKSIELAENIQREDLDYIERINLQKEIYELQIEIQGRKLSTSPNAPGTSIRDVSNMLGISHTKLAEDLKLASTMEQFPDIGWDKLKNRKEALKVKDNIGRVFIRQEAVKNFEETSGTSTKELAIKKLANSYIVGDFFERIKEVPDNSINLIELDPPYAIEIDKIKKREGPGQYSYGESGYNEIDTDDYANFMQDTFKECYRVMAQDSFLICWFGPEPWFARILTWLRLTKFTVRGMPCIWVKGDEEGETTTGQTMSPIRHLGSAYEMFFYAKKGDPKIVKQGRTNVFGYKPVPPTYKIHPTERPLDLMIDVLTTFTEPGSRILIPFLGSGNTILAAYLSKMTALGFDLSEIHKDSFITRLISTL